MGRAPESGIREGTEGPAADTRHSWAQPGIYAEGAVVGTGLGAGLLQDSPGCLRPESSRATLLPALETEFGHSGYLWNLFLGFKALTKEACGGPVTLGTHRRPHVPVTGSW